MYSLDINFLGDRPEYRPPEQKSREPRPAGEKTPLIIGVVVGLLLPAMVGGLWLVLQQRIASLEQKEAEYDAELARLKIGQQKINQLNQQITDVNAETQALATVFNQIKPWSAMMQDIRERTPPNLSIDSIEQIEAPPDKAASTPAPATTGTNANARNARANQNNQQQATTTTSRLATQLEIKGRAKTFDDVNYFLLTLQRSPFFNADKTQLVKAELSNNSDRIEQTDRNRGGGARITYEFPKVVQYVIQADLSDVPASELLRELDRKGAVGLVTRIRKLQEIEETQTGVNQP